MSTAEILAQLPTLPPAELEAIWQTAGRLLEGRALSGSAELRDVIDQADAVRKKDGGLPNEKTPPKLDQ